MDDSKSPSHDSGSTELPAPAPPRAPPRRRRSLLDMETGGALGGPLFGAFLRDSGPKLEILPEGTMIGPWRIKHPLGSGGTATVYLAERADGAFELEVAIKLVRDHPGLHERLRNERDILGKLRHPGIARLIDAGELPDGRVWMAMEPVFGERIDTYVETHRLDWKQRLALLEKVCDAVSHAHSRLLVHRDIKPGNVLIDEHGQPKLLDFGIALSHPDADSRDGAMTPGVASPEQLTGEAVGTPSDVYQLGLLIDQVLPNDSDLDDGDSFIAPAKIRRDLAAIIRCATATEIANRYPSADALRRDLHALRMRRPVQARRGAAIAFFRFVERNWPLISVTSLALIVLTTLALLGIGRIQRERDAAAAAANESAAISRFLTDAFDVADPGSSAGESTSAADILNAGIQRLSTLSDQPSLRASLAAALINVLVNMGEIDDAAALSIVELAQARLNLSQPSAELASLLRAVSGLKIQQAGYDEALRLAQEADAAVEGLRDPLLKREQARNAVSKAVALRWLGQFEEAFKHAEFGVTLASESYGPDDLETSYAWATLGTIAKEIDRYALARDALSRALSIQREHIGSAHRQTLATLHNLAILELVLGELNAAEEHIKAAIAGRRSYYGETHRTVAMSTNTLASIYLQAGQFEQCAQVAQHALDLYRASWGNDHPTLRYSLGNLGVCERENGHMEASMAAFQEALDVLNRGADTPRPGTATFLTELATTALAAGDYSLAESTFRQALAVFESSNSQDEQRYAIAMLGLAYALKAQGRTAEGEDYSAKARALLDGIDHPSWLKTELQRLDRAAARSQRN